ncbi:MAG: P-loop NTPase [Bacilli bacterium]|nr:P-loop NTPase [Bacilli bacterium]
MPEEHAFNPEDFKAQDNPLNRIKKVIGVVSGKGGVGKSLTTSLLAVNAMRDGKKVAILDADITGPSIPTIFGLTEKATGTQEEIYPVMSKQGIAAMSLNLLTDDPAEPVIWRGPVISGLIKQFWSNVVYGEIDEMYIDMPPGTGDVPLTVFQSLPVDAIVVVTSPQDLVSLIVEKALRMATMMNVPVLGVVENMAYLSCPHCEEKIYPFGQSKKAIVDKYGIPVYDSLPIDPKLAEKCDQGDIENYEGEYLRTMSEAIHGLLVRNK